MRLFLRLDIRIRVEAKFLRGRWSRTVAWLLRVVVIEVDTSTATFVGGGVAGTARDVRLVLCTTDDGGRRLLRRRGGGRELKLLERSPEFADVILHDAPLLLPGLGLSEMLVAEEAHHATRLFERAATHVFLRLFTGGVNESGKFEVLVPRLGKLVLECEGAGLSSVNCDRLSGLLKLSVAQSCGQLKVVSVRCDRGLASRNV